MPQVPRLAPALFPAPHCLGERSNVRCRGSAPGETRCCRRVSGSTQQLLVRNRAVGEVARVAETLPDPAPKHFSVSESADNFSHYSSQQSASGRQLCLELNLVPGECKNLPALETQAAGIALYTCAAQLPADNIHNCGHNAAGRSSWRTCVVFAVTAPFSPDRNPSPSTCLPRLSASSPGKNQPLIAFRSVHNARYLWPWALHLRAR